MMLKKSFRLFYQSYWFGTIKQFHLPDLGEKIKEATIKKWHVKEGDMEFQELADVATDKLHTAIPSEYKGKIHKLFHKEEEMCQVGELFIEIELQDDQQTKTVEKQPELKENTKILQNQSINHSNEELFKNKSLASPAVRAILKQNNIDINQIKGTGDQGRVLKSDILEYIQKKENKQSQPEQKQPEIKVLKTESSQNLNDVQIVKMSDYEKGMQKSMTEALSIPHFYLMEEIDITELSELRDSLKKQLNQSLTFMPFFIKTFSLSLNEFPIINSQYDASKPFEYKQPSSHNISIAIDSPKGLVVPNIKNVQNLSMVQIQHQLNSLRDKAQEGKLNGKDLFEGTVSISNIGNICGTYTGPIIMAPQVSIVGIGKIQTLPRYISAKYENGKTTQELVPRKIVSVTYGGDHRVVNGATAARFLKKWKDYLENPSSIFLNLK